MSFTLTTTQAILLKAGNNVSVTASTSGALMQKIADHAEAVVCAYSRFDWVTNYNNILTVGKPLLDEATACYAANELINYDMGNYTNNGEAVTMLNLNLNSFNKAIARLEDQDYVFFLRQI